MAKSSYKERLKEIATLEKMVFKYKTQLDTVVFDNKMLQEKYNEMLLENKIMSKKYRNYKKDVLFLLASIVVIGLYAFMISFYI